MDLDQQEETIVQQQEAIRQRRALLESVPNSHSWKATAPLRKIGALFRNNKN